MLNSVVIGLEVHIELNTKSKMFCACANNSSAEKPNINICPICLGHPGTLPVINKKAVEKTLKTGLALNCQIPEYSQFDRKSYFYPDLPKGYQISQQEAPLCQNGFFELGEERIRIRRIHLEEDAGKLIHLTNQNYSLVDFNRAGVPLMELVTEPDLKSALAARQFTEELRTILRYLDVSKAEMEKGEMRVDANISLSSSWQKKDGVRIEIKNLNSFKMIERALNYEIERQRNLLKRGEKIIQETRGWDDERGETFSQRSKEESDDYRYFPEPDLPILRLKGESPFLELEKLQATISELPKERKRRFQKEYLLSDKEASFLVDNKEWGDYYEKVVNELSNGLKVVVDQKEKSELARLAVNYILSDLRGLLKESSDEIPIIPENLAKLIILIQKGEISNVIAKIVLKEMVERGGEPSHIIDKRGLTELKDQSEIEAIIQEIVQNNIKAVRDYQKGKSASLQFLLGQVMVKTKGRVNPELITEMIKKRL